MEIRERRYSRRLKVNLPVSFEKLGLHKLFGETLSKDISTTGLKLNMNGFCPPNTTFLIKLQFPEVHKIIEGIAKVVWSQRISYSDKYQMGLHFQEINPGFQRMIEEYIQINEKITKTGTP